MKGFGMLRIGEIGWIEKERPVCGPLDAICRPLAVAICTSDVHTVYDGGIGDRQSLILGHECCAEIVETGALVRDFKPGDKVIVPALTPDWSSRQAQAGLPSHSGGMFGSWKFSNTKDGVFGEYFHVNDADGNLALLPEGMSYEEACMLSDMVPTGFQAVEQADVQFGDTVLVIGIGPVGLMSVAGAGMRGASRIIAVGTRSACVEAAKGYGADEIIGYKDASISEQVLALTGGEGVDCVCVAGGNVRTIEEAVKSAAPGAHIGSVTLYSKGDFITIPRAEWGAGQKDQVISGCMMRGGRLRMEKLSSLITAGRLDVRPLCTHVLHGWDRIPDAMELMRQKADDLIKPIVILD